MLQEPFAFGNSWMHRLDPRVRLVTAFFYSVVVALSRNFTTLTVAMVTSILLIVLVQLPSRLMIRRIFMVNMFTFFFWLILPLTFQGQPTFTMGPLRVYHAGIIMALRITLKSNSILLALIALIATMPFPTLGWALSRLRIPDKIVHLLLMTYRYVFVIDQEFKKIIRAVRIRGFQPGTNLHTYKTYAYIVGMLFFRSILRADRVYKAMLCRGFKRKFYCLHEFSTGKSEWFFVSAVGAMTLVLIYVEWLQPKLLI